jgi:nitroreductase
MNRIRRRLAGRFLPWALRSRSLASLYYAFFSPKFSREHYGVVTGQKEFAISEGPGGGTSTLLRRNTHRLEKGLIMRPRRDVFALAYIEETVLAYKRAVEETQGAAGAEVCWARDVLDAYFEACASDELIDRLRTDFRAIPKLSTDCLPDRAKAFRPYSRKLDDPIPVSYADLLKLAARRRSVRWFEQKPVPRELIEKAVLLAGLSPSACNRQPFEFRFFDDPKLIAKVAGLPGGTVGFHENFPLIGVVLGSLAHYYDEKDRHLIYVDGGLATMGLVYALETLGLGTCCINWPDIEEDETRAAQVLGLKPYERPVMFLAVGYPDPKGLVPYSEKKPVSQLCRWNQIGHPLSHDH